MINGVRKAFIAVDDQEAAKQFWTSKLGFEVVVDQTYGDERWIEVTPPDRRVILALTLRDPDEPRRDVPDHLPHSNLFFNCENIEQTHRELTDKGVKFALAPEKQHFGWWSLFEDDEGSRYALGQWDNAS